MRQKINQRFNQVKAKSQSLTQKVSHLVTRISKYVDPSFELQTSKSSVIPKANPKPELEDKKTETSLLIFPTISPHPIKTKTSFKVEEQTPYFTFWQKGEQFEVYVDEEPVSQHETKKDEPETKLPWFQRFIKKINKNYQDGV